MKQAIIEIRLWACSVLMLWIGYLAPVEDPNGLVLLTAMNVAAKKMMDRNQGTVTR